MKLLLGADQYPEYINGAANFTVRLAAGLAARGHTVTVVWPSHDAGQRTYTADGMRVHRLRSYRLPRTGNLRVCTPRASLAASRAVLRQVRPDVVHIQSHLMVGRGLAKAAAEQSYPLVATNHFMPENIVGHIPLVRRWPQGVTDWVWRDLAKVFKHADLVTAPTPRAVELLRSAAGIDTARAISCGVDADRYRTATENSPIGGVPTVLFVGRIEHEKRVDELLRAYAAVPAGIASRLEIVGAGGQEGNLAKLSQQLGLGGRVVFRGQVSDAQLLDSYARSSVFCMPGTAELQSLATLEAMAAGMPIIAADAMALPHLVIPRHNGYLYTPGDTTALTRHLTELLTDPAQRRRMGHLSRTMVADHSLNATLDSFEQCCQSVLPRGAAVTTAEAIRHGYAKQLTPSSAPLHHSAASHRHALPATAEDRSAA
jgi:phosphatidylinositol alpha 1,6-mannosyltransferase